MKKNPLVPILGGGVIAALVLGVMAVIVLVDAGLLHLLGVRCDSFGWLVLYVLVEAVLGLPLELFTAGLTKALVKLGVALLVLLAASAPAGVVAAGDGQVVMHG